MIIPKEHLDKVEYYDVKYTKDLFGRRKTVVILHYKDSFKVPKKFKFRWLYSDGFVVEPQAAQILQNYLIQYFKE